MYVVAQRVISPVSRETGINTFLYVHPGRHWTVPPTDINAADPGRLARKNIAVAPNGNRIRSNFEFVAPDDVDLVQARKGFFTFLERAQFEALPWEGVQGPCLYRVHMVPQIYKVNWSGEVQALASAGVELVEAARQPRHLRAVPSPR
jgi:hypothetical protein